MSTSEFVVLKEPFGGRSLMKKKLMISASIALGIALAGGILGSFTASHPLDVNAAEGDKYVLLDPSDVGSLKDTQTVLITSVDGQNIMGPQGNGIRSRVSISGSAYDKASGILTGTSQVTESTEFHLAKVGDYWTIQEVAAGTYLYFTGSSNKVYSGNGSAEDNSSYQWTLNQGSEAFKIANRATPARILQYNSKDPRFACYTGSQQDVNIFVKQEAPDYTVDSITVEKGEGAKDTYLVGEVFESAGYTVTAHYTNSTTADVTVEVIWPTNPLTIEDTSVEISYTFFGKTVTAAIPVTVQNREVTGITIQSEPDKTEYVLNETLDLSGLVVMATYNAGEPADVTASVTTDPADGVILTQAGSIAVKVTYEGHETSFNINVEEGPDYSFEFTKKDFDEPIQTKMLGDISWTLNAKFSGGTYFGMDTSDNRGFQIGSSKNQASEISLRTTNLFLANNDAVLVQKVVVNASGASDINANLEVKIGDTVIGTAKKLTSDATDYTFIASEPLMGRVEILITPISGSKLGAAAYIKSITIYADESNEYAGMALLVAEEIEAADVCNGELTALQSVKQSYDDLGAKGQALINNVYLDDYADGDIHHDGGRIYNRITVAEKVAAIESAIATKSIEASSFGVFGNNNNTIFITLLSLASLIGVGGIGFFFLKKKKGAH